MNRIDVKKNEIVWPYCAIAYIEHHQMLNEGTAEERWKEARQRHMEMVALKRAKRKKKPTLSATLAQVQKKRSGSSHKTEKRVDPRTFWYHPTLSSSFINYCQHGLSRKKQCHFCEADERNDEDSDVR